MKTANDLIVKALKLSKITEHVVADGIGMLLRTQQLPTVPSNSWVYSVNKITKESVTAL